MGAFRIVIEGVGGHGDDRAAQEGETITIAVPSSMDHHSHFTPDRVAKLAVDLLKEIGVSDLAATLTHWPGEESEVVDDLVSMTRAKGAFAKPASAAEPEGAAPEAAS